MDNYRITCTRDYEGIPKFALYDPYNNRINSVIMSSESEFIDAVNYFILRGDLPEEMKEKVTFEGE
ncbi:hypothetical protein A2415_02455 [candidate division WWE3 bacterium RIFOXYC1_FULL_39_7]|uniref:Uncharacterized protein n=2 Tax=Katanobacteria TaxID=422282 RepID=A0A1F4X7Q1_UNCKA|nr:MAG: hypothetical protein A2415_02455 [candidate division WWE3 bacterium RIFOXYC1_FULL_39_7]OGC77571.1 MAG: hypothetical protein A2619_01060 [candidate division WWE3 bacterium RIFOXYD1_FULL_39_9]